MTETKPDYGDEKKTTSEWEDIYEITILDPDGWDRSNNFEKDWAIPLTQLEWEKKMFFSTIRTRQKIKPCSFYRSW